MCPEKPFMPFFRSKLSFILQKKHNLKVAERPNFCSVFDQTPNFFPLPGLSYTYLTVIFIFNVVG